MQRVTSHWIERQGEWELAQLYLCSRPILHSIHPQISPGPASASMCSIALFGPPSYTRIVWLHED